VRKVGVRIPSYNKTMDLLSYAPQALLWLSGLVVVAVGCFLSFVYWDQRGRSDTDQ
jgi:uncharacterized protein YjeT (DUF2065 family)